LQTIADYGFTDRQAGFLVQVMRHAGVCVKRQYATFAGVANGGEKCNAFFAKLIRRGYAVASDCVHNRAQLFHVHHKPLYYAIGEPESRYRRPVPARRAAERLMLLDAVLASPDLEWLTTASEKVAYLTKLNPPEPVEPSADATVDAEQKATVAFPGTFPIGLEPEGRVVLLYLATVPWTDEFRTFLQGHAALLRVAATWTLRLVFPRPVDHAYAAYQSVIREELETPLHPATIGELKWYFEHRRKAEGGPVHPLTQKFLDKGAELFGNPRFTRLYRRWVVHGNTVFEAAGSPVIAEALASGRAKEECLVLPHAYHHLTPLVTHRRSHREGVEKSLRRGNREGNRPRHTVNPVVNPVS
jgi:hypothetical protein